MLKTDANPGGAIAWHTHHASSSSDAAVPNPLRAVTGPWFFPSRASHRTSHIARASHPHPAHRRHPHAHCATAASPRHLDRTDAADPHPRTCSPPASTLVLDVSHLRSILDSISRLFFFFPSLSRLGFACGEFVTGFFSLFFFFHRDHSNPFSTTTTNHTHIIRPKQVRSKKTPKAVPTRPACVCLHLPLRLVRQRPPLAVHVVSQRRRAQTRASGLRCLAPSSLSSITSPRASQPRGPNSQEEDPKSQDMPLYQEAW